jgi:hypothetical protein
MAQKLRSKSYLRRHSLSLSSFAILALLIVLYSNANPATHWGSFFGNAIADWTGVFVTVLMTKHLYEKGSAESKKPKGMLPSAVMEFVREHSLTIFLVITGIGWVMTFRHMDTGSKWGQVVGNIVSEWTQIFGLVLLTKKMIEVGSKESGSR